MRKIRVALGWFGAVLWVCAAGAQMPQHVQLIAQLGHSGDVKAAVFSADGKLMLTGGNDGSARLWEAATGTELRRFYSAYGPVAGVAISRDGRHVLTSGDSEYGPAAQLWDAASGKELHRFAGGDGPALSVSFSRDGRYALTAGGRSAVLWNASSGAEVRRFETIPGKVVSAALSADGRRVLTGGGKKVSMWDAASGKLLWQYVSTTESFNAVALSPNDAMVLAGGVADTAAGARTGVALLLNAGTGRILRRLTGHKFPVTSVAFSNTGARAATGSNDWTARVWDVATGRELKKVDEGMYIDGVQFSPDGSELLTTSFNRATLWNVATGVMQRELRGAAEPIHAVRISDDDHYLLTGGPRDAEQLWDLQTGKLLQWYTGPFPAAEWAVSDAAEGGFSLRTRSGYAVPVKAGGFDAATTDWMAPPAIRGLRAGTDSDDDDPDVYSPEKAADAAKNPPPRSVSYIPSGGCGSDDPATPVGRLQQQLQAPLEFSADCRIAMFGSSDGTTRLWDVKSGTELAACISFTAGGWAVVDAEGRFDTSDLDGGAPLHWVVNDDPFHALPLEIFMRDYYTPGLLARVMKGEALPPVRSIAEIKNRVQPEVRVASVMPSAKIAGRMDVTVRAASVTDAKGVKSGLQDLRLFRDGQMVADGYREGVLKDGDFVFHDVMLKSDAKKVTFTAYAFNSERIKSATASLEYEAESPLVSVVKRKAYLLQIGVNHYAASGCELKYSVNDAEMMSAALSERLKAQGFEVVAVKLESAAANDGVPTHDDKAVMNGPPTKVAIQKRLAEIAAKATPDDAFFMSFSGHGYSAAGGAFYILPSSASGSCAKGDELELGTLLSADELANWLRPIDAGEMTLILDACYSAESVQAGDFKPGPMGSRGLGQVAYDKRIRVLAASQSDEVAREYDYLGEGLLTYTLTRDGLNEGKADWKPVNKKITVGEWLGYAADAVPKFIPGGAATTNAKVAGAEAEGECRGNCVKKAPGPATHYAVQVPALFDFSKADTLVLQLLPEK